MKLNIEIILKENDLYVTPARKKILELFLKTGRALINAEIEKACSGTINHVSVYRTLQSFLKKGIIHLIPTSVMTN